MAVNDPKKPQEMDPEELVALLDELCATGTQHINLTVGEETTVQTLNSTECSGILGACAIPTLGGDPDEDDEA